MPHVVEIVGWTLVHFLWQASLVWLLFALSIRVAADQSANVRYLLGLASLAALAIIPVITFCVLLAQPEGLPGGAMRQAVAQWSFVELSAMMPLAVIAWGGGVAYRFWQVIHDLIRVGAITHVGCRQLPAHWQQLVDEMSGALSISRPVKIMESLLVQVPAAVGWLRPVVLIPSSALLGLTRQQLELIIAHELAHIQRFDYVVNLSQVALETVFFFHPAVLSISREVRAEREICCDEMVVRSGGNRYQYAQALALLENVRAMPAGTNTAMAANGGQLLARIERLASDGCPRRHNLIGSLALFTAGIAGVAGFVTVILSNDAPPRELLMLEPPVGRMDVSAQTLLAMKLVPAAEPAVTAEALQLATLPDAVELPARPAIAPIGRAEFSLAEAAEHTAAVMPLQILFHKIKAVNHALSIPSPSLPAQTTPRLASAPVMLYETTAQDREADAMALLSSKPIYTPPVASGQAARGIRQLYALSNNDGGDLIFRVDPQYPSSARTRGVEGTVTVDFAVNEVGSVEDIQIVGHGVRSGFRRSVKQAVALWKYSPLRRDGLPVTYRQTQTFTFRLLTPLLVAQGQSCIPNSNKTWACRSLQGTPN